MTWSEGALDRTVATIRFGFAEYFAANPWTIVLTTEWPRAVLQCLFFSLLGQVAAGDQGGRFAYVGSIAMVTLLSTAVGVADVPGVEKWTGTFYRLQLTRSSPAWVFALRSLAWTAQGFAGAVLSWIVVGPLLGHSALTVALLPALPLYALMALTGTAAGLAVASPAIGRRADVLVGNALAYLVIAAGGIVLPPRRVPVLDAIGSVLPLRHGVLAVRAVVAGRPWGRQAALEAAVGAGWAVTAAVLYRRQALRARRTGSDDFA